MGGACSEIDFFPNATVAEHGLIDFDDNVVEAIMKEVFVRGPVAATINAEPIVGYKGGIFADDSFSVITNHIVSIVGWGTDQKNGNKHWIIRKYVRFVPCDDLPLLTSHVVSHFCTLSSVFVSSWGTT